MTVLSSDRPGGPGPNQDTTLGHRIQDLLDRWYRPQTGRMTVFLLAALQLGIPSVLRSTEWVDFGTASLAPEWLTAGGMLAGWLTARVGTRASGRLAKATGLLVALGAMLLGCLLLIQQLTGIAGRIADWSPALAHEGSMAGVALELWSHTVAEIGSSLQGLGGRVDFWLQGVRGPGAQQDDLIFIGICGLVLFLVAFHATWMTLSERPVLFGLLPSVALTAFIVFYSQGSRLSAVAYLAGMLMLYAWQGHRHQKASWDDRGMDYPESLVLDRALGVLAMLAMMVFLASVAPSINVREIQRWVNSILHPVDTVTTDMGSRMFPEMQGKFHGRRQSEAGGLPNSFLLGAPPEITNTLALTVTTSSRLDESVGFYMRAKTFQHYDGRGWSNPDSRMDSRIEPNADLDPSLYPHVLPVWQSVTRHNQSSLLYAIPEPVRATVSLAPERDTGGTALFYRAGGQQSYNVLSNVPRLGEDVLTSVTLDSVAGSIDEYVLGYLQLPDSVSEQTRTLASRLASGHETLYGLGLAVEAHLREYPYDLEVSLPGPEVEDVAHHFLFDLKRGYCDYYTTAFVVLMRLAGIPARFTIGYAPGYFEPYIEEWTFTDAQAHAWPEVWFPGLGWIPFEPTAGRAGLDRAFVAPAELQGRLTDGTALDGADMSAPSAGGFSSQSLFWLLFLVPAGYVAWLVFERRSRGDAWLLLLGWGARIGSPKHPADTETEYLTRMEGTLQTEHRMSADAHRFLGRALRGVAASIVLLRYARGIEPAYEEVFTGNVRLIVSRLQRLWIRRKLRV